MLFGGTIQLFSIISNLKCIHVYVQIVIPLLLNTFYFTFIECGTDFTLETKQQQNRISFFFNFGMG